MFKSYLKHRHFKHNTAGVSYTPKVRRSQVSTFQRALPRHPENPHV